MLTLKTVRWGNCFSYGDNNELHLDQSKIVQLVGDNGSGKSSLALIIQEVLFNKNVKGIKKAKIANRNLDNSYWIELDFSHGEDEYMMSVTRKSSVKVKLIKNGEDISSHTATGTFKTIEDIFGMDAKVFFQLIYQSVKTGLDFLTATDSNRKKFLIELFAMDEYAEYHEMFKDLASDLNSEVAKLRGSLESTQRWITKNSQVPDEMELIDVPDLPDISEKENELWEKKDKVKNSQDTNRRISSNNKLKDLVKTITYNLEFATKQPVDVSPMTSAIGGLQAQERVKKSFLDKMKKLGEVCPTCEQEIDSEKLETLIAEAKAELDKIEEELSEQNQAKQEALAENAEIQKNKKAKQEKESIIKQIDMNLESDLVDVHALEAEIDSLTKEIREVKFRYEQAIDHNTKAEAHNTRIGVILEQIAEHEQEVAQIQSELSELEQEYSKLDILKKVFSNNGLVAYKLESLVKDIEELANDYLAELSDGRFTLTFTVDSDKLNVQLTDEGLEIEINELSAGELSRVNTAMLLAIRKMMNSISKTQINILFLDEIVGVLDDFGREKLIEVLLAEEGLNTFLVSHEWSHPLLEKVNVVKKDNISRLQFS